MRANAISVKEHKRYLFHQRQVFFDPKDKTQHLEPQDHDTVAVIINNTLKNISILVGVDDSAIGIGWGQIILGNDGYIDEWDFRNWIVYFI